MTSPTSGSTSGYTSAFSSTSSISGLISGMDTSTIISQLMSIEAQPQNLLKTQQAQAQAQGDAYRQINTAMATLSSAAQALTNGGMTGARTVGSSDGSVAASADATAVPGSSLSFAVTHLAAAQTSISAGTWSSATADVTTSAAADSPAALPGWPLSVVSGGKTVGTIALPAGASLNDAAAAITNSGYGLSATVVQLDSGHYKLQVRSTATGAAAAFSLQSSADPTGAGFTPTTTAQDATLDLGNGMTATSSTNTFNQLLTGVSVTVSQLSPVPSGSTTPTPTTITVSNDVSAVTGKVQALIDAANAALTTIHNNTDSSDGSTAVLKGDWTLNSLAGQVLDVVSKAVDGPASQQANLVGGASAKMAGIELTKDGAITFDPAAFTALLSSNPALAQQIVGGATGPGADGVSNTPDDTIDTDGLAARLSVLAEQASDSTTGMITSLASSEDAQVKDLQSQIDDWTLRLQQRQQTLQDQFDAMETALGTLKSQSSWLTSQINSLPSSNSSSK